MASKSACPRRQATPEGPGVPLALWAVAQTSAQYQRAGRYTSDCYSHPAKMLPALARRIVETYTEPGDLVVDPMCGIGTTLAEAASVDRHAVGIELEERWTQIARTNLAHLLDDDQRHLTRVKTGDARHLAELLGPQTAKVDAVVLSPPYDCDVSGVDRSRWNRGHALACTDGSANYSADRANLGYARNGTYIEAMSEIYASCARVLRPGGVLVTVTKNTRRAGRCFDLAALTVDLARGAGLSYLQHVVALHAAVRRGALSARPSFWQTTHIRHAQQRGKRAHLIVHEDVLVFRKPEPDGGSR